MLEFIERKGYISAMIKKHLGRVDNILNFWFGDKIELSEVYIKERMSFWFKKDRAVDNEIKSRFELEDYKLSVQGKTTPWRETPRGCLAQILVFDQFPRNMFRGNKQMYATDCRALEIAKHAISERFDKKLSPIERMFLYMPFQHSENSADQKLSLDLINELAKESPLFAHNVEYAKKHASVINRFGRFPHRNEIFGRISTQEETEFLKTAGAVF